MRTLHRLALCASVLAAHTAANATTFDFESIATNTNVPFAYTVSGLTATFGGGANYKVYRYAFGLPAGISGGYLIDYNSYSGNLNVGFSQPLTSLSSAIATTKNTTVTLSAFLGGNLVGTSTAVSTSAGTTIGFSGVAFDSVAFSNPDRVQLYADNINATPVPEPSALAALGFGAVAFVKRRKRV